MTTGRGSTAIWLRLWIVFGLFAFAGLCICVLMQNKPPFFDEIPYLAQADAYRSSESFKQWLLNNDTGATGPVHALMQYGISGGKGVLDAPWFRVPNLGLLAGVLALLGLTIKATGGENAWGKALVGMAIPMTWVIAGMALTELSAMIGMMAALYAAACIGSKKEYSGFKCLIWGGVIACGVAIAVCSRQTYLVAVPAIPLLAARDRRSFWLALACAMFGMLPALWLFMIWGGLVPPKMAYVGHGIVFNHGVLAFGYAGLTAVLIAPGYFFEHRRIALPISLVAVVLNLCTNTVQFGTMTSVQKLIGHPELTLFAVWLGQQLFVFSGAAFVVITVCELIERRERQFAGYTYGVVSLCLACIWVTHLFSSRYVCMSLPFLVLMLAPWIRFTPWALVRWGGAMSLGAAILYSYYAVH
jgi:hypothetical protein